MRGIRYLGPLVGFVILAAVLYMLDAGQIGRSLTSIPPAYAIAGLLLVQLQIVLSAWRWQFTARRLGMVLPVGHAIRDYYLSTFLNQVLPGGVAGDAVRAVRHRTDETGGWKAPALGVFLERVAGQGVFFVLAGLGLIIWPFANAGKLPPTLSRILLILATVGVCALVVGFVILRFPPAFLAERLEAGKAALCRVFIADGAWKTQSLLSLLIVASYAGMFMLASAAVGAPLPLLAAVTAVPLCLLMMLIPLTVAGWGAREAAAALLWPLFGYAASDGVAASIFYGVLSLVGAAPGLVVAVLALAGRNKAGRANH